MSGEVSGDRLAQIEGRQPRWVQNSLNGFRKEITLTVEERDALVEIAKAARPFGAPVLTPWLDGEEAYHVEKLRSALARLDSGAAEEDA